MIRALRHRALLLGGAGTPLSKLAVGDVVKIMENGSPVNFILIAKDYPAAGDTLLMRSASAGQMPMGADDVYLSIRSYSGSNIDTWLGNTYLARFSADVQNLIQAVTIDSHEITGSPGTLQATTINCKVFILSATEITGQASNAEGTKIPYFTSLAMVPATNVWTRQVAQTSAESDPPYDLYFYNMFGESYNDREYSDVPTNDTSFNVLPCLCLPDSAKVDKDGNLIVKPPRPPKTTHLYGFHIDSSVSDPANAVTYIEDAAGMTPAKMTFGGSFSYGDWGDAFFLPKPCMLKYDGTVDYYLDPDNYAYKEDGVTPSDVADDTYAGNAMMEWGQNGKRIWYKVVPDVGDDTSASVYIADYQADSQFRAWSFINNDGDLVDHFYTPIYPGTIDGNGKLRSISGMANTDLCNGLTATQEIAAAELNNQGDDVLWHSEVFADVTLVNLLLILIGKTLDTQGTFGNGRVAQTTVEGHEIESCLGTGTMDDKGLFYGSNNNAVGVKVFGMEHWWGNQWRRYSGLVCNEGTYKYKMTYGTQDGSAQDGYAASASADDYSGYLSAVTVSAMNGYISAQKFGAWGFLPSAASGSASTYWCDNFTIGISSVRYVRRGGYASASRAPIGAFVLQFNAGIGTTNWNLGACLSCKPKSV